MISLSLFLSSAFNQKNRLKMRSNAFLRIFKLEKGGRTGGNKKNEK